MGGRIRGSGAGWHLAKLAASGRSSGRLQLQSKGVGKVATVTIGMAVPPPCPWGLEAAEAHCRFPHAQEGAHALARTRSSGPGNADRTARTVPSFPGGRAPPVEGEDG